MSREEQVDSTLLKNDSGVESALLYAKAWSKYIKDLLAWMEKRLAMGETKTSQLFGHTEQLGSRRFSHSLILWC